MAIYVEIRFHKTAKYLFIVCLVAILPPAPLERTIVSTFKIEQLEKKGHFKKSKLKLIKYRQTDSL